MATSIAKIEAFLSEDLKAFNLFLKDLLKSDVFMLRLMVKYLLKKKGKRIRPILIFLTARLYGETTEKTVRVAALVELLHTATLVHDDIVDKASYRRGQLSLKKKWGNKFAVLAGDFLLAKGMLLALESKDFDILSILSRAIKEMSEGEILQLDKSAKMNLSQEDYFKIIEKKTASLFAACTACGFRSVKQDDKVEKNLWDFGKNLGCLFQITDDIFDIQNHLSGKNMFTDMHNQHLTLPLIYSLNNSTYKEKRTIYKIIKKKEEANFAYIINHITEKKGIQYAQNMIQEQQKIVMDKIQHFPPNKIRDMFVDLVDWLTKRVV